MEACGLTAGAVCEKSTVQRRDTCDWTSRVCVFGSSNGFPTYLPSATGHRKKGSKDMQRAQESGVSVGMLEQLRGPKSRQSVREAGRAPGSGVTSGRPKLSSCNG